MQRFTRTPRAIALQQTELNLPVDRASWRTRCWRREAIQDEAGRGGGVAGRGYGTRCRTDGRRACLETTGQGRCEGLYV